MAPKLFSQVLPKEGSRLNYRLIGFSFPQKENTHAYSVEIAKGNHTDEKTFKKNICRTVKSDINKVIAEVPSFGCDYTWRVSSSGGASELHHFSVFVIPESDTAVFRLRIAMPAKKYRNAHVFVDGSRSLYDMQGHPLWFLPYIEGSNVPPRDMKLTPQHTITFLLGDKAYEVNYNGDILWKGPNTGAVSGEQSEHYHHELTRLDNGHYMLLGQEQVLVKLPTAKENSQVFVKYEKALMDSAPKLYYPTLLGTIIEYDEHSNVVWSWRSSGYFVGKKLEDYKTSEGVSADFHQNAFYFDKAAGYVYTSFKGANCILKVKYPEGTVVQEYKGRNEADSSKHEDDLFCGQHCCGKTTKGELFTFNNNLCDPSSGPRIEMMQEPPGPGNLVKTWEYNCEEGKEAKKIKAAAGGNIIELPGGEIFAIMGVPDSRVFIISRDKTKLWSAYLERWSPEGKRWGMSPVSYRASIISDGTDLTKLVCDAQ